MNVGMSSAYVPAVLLSAKHPQGRSFKEGVRVKGHWLYVRKCLTKAEQGGIVLAEKSQEPSGCEAGVWHEILAIGEDVGKPRKQSKTRRTSSTPAIVSAGTFNIGDIVLAPPDHPWGIRHSALSSDEFFLDESILLAAVEA